jgi:two-component system, NarL family, nitrate/nitrite response regulator NarL
VSERIRLAVVEDQLFTREVTIKLLHVHYGDSSKVTGFATVEELLDWEDSEFDVVVLDLQLRGGSLEGSDAIHAAVRRGRVLVFSSLESGEALERAHAAGALGYVSKDTGGEQTLIDGVDAVLAGDSFVDPELLTRIGASARKQLTTRQQEVLRLEALGCNVSQIAPKLGLSEAGVRRHIERIVEIHPDCAKAERVRLAIELGLVTPWETSQRYPAPR